MPDLPISVLTKNQKKILGWKPYTENGEHYRIKAEIRWDDSCNNGRNSFAITGETQRKGGNGRWYEDCCGCIHDKIAAQFPEVSSLVQWHLFDSNGPMHYIENTVFLAGDLDCWKRRKGDVSRYEYGVRFNDVPITHTVSEKFFRFLKERNGTGDFTVCAISHDRDSKTYTQHYTFVGYGDKWHECPFNAKVKADEFAAAMNNCSVEYVKIPVEFSQGKERELDKARSVANWPDATDDDLTAPGLQERLLTRLVPMMVKFKRDIEALGFVY